MSIQLKGNTLRIDAAASLGDLLVAEGLPAALADAARREPGDLQAAAVVAHLLAADGRSPLAAAMLALDAELQLADGGSMGYGSLLALRPHAAAHVLSVSLSTAASLDCLYDETIWLALARWPAGRTRLALGGWGLAPVLAMDGRDASGILEAAENALAGADEGRLTPMRGLVAQVTLA